MTLRNRPKPENQRPWNNTWFAAGGAHRPSRHEQIFRVLTEPSRPGSDDVRAAQRRPTNSNRGGTGDDPGYGATDRPGPTAAPTAAPGPPPVPRVHFTTAQAANGAGHGSRPIMEPHTDLQLYWYESIRGGATDHRPFPGRRSRVSWRPAPSLPWGMRGARGFVQKRGGRGRGRPPLTELLGAAVNFASRSRISSWNRPAC